MKTRILYHGTAVQNFMSIETKGILHKFEGVYLTDSKESAANWCGFKLAAQGQNELLVFEVEVDEDNCQPGVDHSPLMQSMFGAGESVLHNGDISPENIKEVYKFKIGKDEDN